MSIQAIQAVLSHSRHTSDERLLLVVIPDCIDKGTGEAFPSVAYLMQRANMGERRIYRVLKRLKAGGELQVISGSGCRQSNRYSLNPLPLPNTDAGDSINTDAGDSIQPSPNTDKPSIGILTNRARNTDNGSGSILSESFKNPRERPNADAFSASAPSLKVRKRTGTKTAARKPWLEGFALSPEMREMATAKGCASPERAFEAFRDKCLAHGYKYVSFEAAWRSWGWKADVGPADPSSTAPISPYGPPKPHAPEAPISDEERRRNGPRLRALIEGIGRKVG